MPARYARRLTGRRRTPQANLELGLTLAFVAGATNAAGFLLIACRPQKTVLTGARQRSRRRLWVPAPDSR